MNKAIIAAPFGAYLKLPGVTSTRGTYTNEPRLGAIWGAMTRIKFTKHGVINRMGLRNPGIRGQDFAKHHDAIWSIAGLHYIDWLECIELVPENATVELNFSCPNVKVAMYTWQIRDIMSYAQERFKNVIVKLTADISTACTLFDCGGQAGIKIFHACNTIATEYGGLSGRAIQRYSIPLVKLLHREGFTVIGGGGIYTPDDVKRYRDAGANHFSLGTIFFTPWRLPAVLWEINR